MSNANEVIDMLCKLLGMGAKLAARAIQHAVQVHPSGFTLFRALGNEHVEAESCGEPMAVY
jgi:hypothetical protein